MNYDGDTGFATHFKDIEERLVDEVKRLSTTKLIDAVLVTTHPKSNIDKKIETQLLANGYVYCGDKVCGGSAHHTVQLMCKFRPYILGFF